MSQKFISYFVKRKFLFFVSLIIFLIIIGILLASLIRSGYTIGIMYDDDLQRKTIHIISYEYLNDEGFIPLNFRSLNNNPNFNDFECDIILGELIENNNIIFDNECNEPIWWNDYAFETETGEVKLSFRIFDNDDIQDYLDYLNNMMENLFLIESLIIGKVESRVTIIPTSPGPAADHIDLYYIILQDDMIEDTHMLISFIKSDNTIYIIAEESNDEIASRRLTNSFWPEYHDQFIRIHNITLIEQ